MARDLTAILVLVVLYSALAGVLVYAQSDGRAVEASGIWRDCRAEPGRKYLVCGGAE